MADPFLEGLQEGTQIGSIFQGVPQAREREQLKSIQLLNQLRQALNPLQIQEAGLGNQQSQLNIDNLLANLPNQNLQRQVTTADLNQALDPVARQRALDLQAAVQNTGIAENTNKQIGLSTVQPFIAPSIVQTNNLETQKRTAEGLQIPSAADIAKSNELKSATTDLGLAQNKFNQGIFDSINGEPVADGLNGDTSNGVDTTRIKNAVINKTLGIPDIEGEAYATQAKDLAGKGLYIPGMTRNQMNAASRTLNQPKMTTADETVLKDLSNQTATKVSIANQIQQQVATLKDDSVDYKTKVALAQQMLKTLNSTEGKDAVGAEEAKRLGGLLTFYWLPSITRPLKGEGAFLPGRDLAGFATQADQTLTNLRKAIDTNTSAMANIEKLYGVKSASTTGALNPPIKSMKLSNGGTVEILSNQ